MVHLVKHVLNHINRRDLFALVAATAAPHSCCAMLCHVMPFSAMLCHAVPCCAMLCHSLPCCAMLCHAVLCQRLLHLALTSYRHVTGHCRQAHNIPPQSLSKSMLNTSLVLFNADWASNNPQPLAPHLVSCGAMSAKSAQPLPPDLASFVETALEGVVYASLGTTIIPGMRL